MSFGALFGLADDKVRPVKASAKTLGIDPVLYNQLVRYYTAIGILGLRLSVNNAKSYAQVQLKNLNQTRLNSFKNDIFTQANSDQVQEQVWSGNAPVDDIAALIAMGVQLPNDVQSINNVSKNITHAFGKSIIQPKRSQPKNPFDPNVGHKTKTPLPKPATRPGQNRPQKQEHAAKLEKLYQEWLANGGLYPTFTKDAAGKSKVVPAPDTPQNRKIWSHLLKTPMSSSGNPINIDTHPAWQNPYDVAMSHGSSPTSLPQQQSGAAFVAAQNAYDANDIAHYAALLSQGLISNTAMPNFNSNSSEAQNYPGAPDYGQTTITPQDNWYVPQEEAPPSSGSSNFYDAAAAAHGFQGIDEISALYPSRHRRKRVLRFSGLGARPARLVMRDDSETSLPISPDEAAQLVAFIKAVAAATVSAPLNQDPGYINTSKFSHSDVVAADKFGKTIAGLVISNKGLLEKLGGLANSGGTPNPILKTITDSLPPMITNVQALTSAIAAAYQTTPSSGASGGGSQGNYNVDPDNTDYSDGTYYQKMAELQKAASGGLKAITKSWVVSLGLGMKLGTAKKGSAEASILNTLIDGLKATEKILDTPKKKQSSAKPPPAHKFGPFWQNAPQLTVTQTGPQIVANPFTPSTPPQLAPVGGSWYVEPPPDEPTFQPTTPLPWSPIPPGSQAVAGLGELFG